MKHNFQTINVSQQEPCQQFRHVSCC